MAAPIEPMLDTEEASEPNAPKHRLTFILVSAVLLPLVYVLSVGPVVWALQKGAMPPSNVTIQIFTTFYAPLVALDKQCEWFHILMEAYVGWFRS